MIWKDTWLESREISRTGDKTRTFLQEIFVKTKYKLSCVPYTLFSEQQADGDILKWQNVSPREYFIILFKSEEFSKKTLKDFLIVCYCQLVSRLESERLRCSSWNCLSFSTSRQLESQLFNLIKWSSKTKSGGLRAIKNKAVKIYIWNRRMLDINLNV